MRIQGIELEDNLSSLARTQTDHWLPGTCFSYCWQAHATMLLLHTKPDTMGLSNCAPACN